MQAPALPVLGGHRPSPPVSANTSSIPTAANYTSVDIGYDHDGIPNASSSFASSGGTNRPRDSSGVTARPSWQQQLMDEVLPLPQQPAKPSSPPAQRSQTPHVPPVAIPTSPNNGSLSSSIATDTPRSILRHPGTAGQSSDSRPASRQGRRRRISFINASPPRHDEDGNGSPSKSPSGDRVHFGDEDEEDEESEDDEYELTEPSLRYQTDTPPTGGEERQRDTDRSGGAPQNSSNITSTPLRVQQSLVDRLAEHTPDVGDHLPARSPFRTPLSASQPRYPSAAVAASAPPAPEGDEITMDVPRYAQSPERQEDVATQPHASMQDRRRTQRWPTDAYHIIDPPTEARLQAQRRKGRESIDPEDDEENSSGASDATGTDDFSSPRKSGERGRRSGSRSASSEPDSRSETSGEDSPNLSRGEAVEAVPTLPQPQSRLPARRVSPEQQQQQLQRTPSASPSRGSADRHQQQRPPSPTRPTSTPSAEETIGNDVTVSAITANPGEAEGSRRNRSPSRSTEASTQSTPNRAPHQVPSPISEESIGQSVSDDGRLHQYPPVKRGPPPRPVIQKSLGKTSPLKQAAPRAPSAHRDAKKPEPQVYVDPLLRERQERRHVPRSEHPAHLSPRRASSTGSRSGLPPTPDRRVVPLLADPHRQLFQSSTIPPSVDEDQASSRAGGHRRHRHHRNPASSRASAVPVPSELSRVPSSLGGVSAADLPELDSVLLAASVRSGAATSTNSPTGRRRVMRKKLVVVTKRHPVGAEPSAADEVMKISLMPHEQGVESILKPSRRHSSRQPRGEAGEKGEPEISPDRPLERLIDHVEGGRSPSRHSSEGGEGGEGRRKFRSALSVLSSRNTSRRSSVSPTALRRSGSAPAEAKSEPEKEETEHHRSERRRRSSTRQSPTSPRTEATASRRRRRHHSRSSRHPHSSHRHRTSPMAPLADGPYSAAQNEAYYNQLIPAVLDGTAAGGPPVGITPVSMHLLPKLRLQAEQRMDAQRGNAHVSLDAMDGSEDGEEHAKRSDGRYHDAAALPEWAAEPSAAAASLPSAQIAAGDVPLLDEPLGKAAEKITMARNANPESEQREDEQDEPLDSFVRPQSARRPPWQQPHPAQKAAPLSAFYGGGSGGGGGLPYNQVTMLPWAASPAASAPLYVPPLTVDNLNLLSSDWQRTLREPKSKVKRQQMEDFLLASAEAGAADLGMGQLAPPGLPYGGTGLPYNEFYGVAPSGGGEAQGNGAASFKTIEDATVNDPALSSRRRRSRSRSGSSRRSGSDPKATQQAVPLLPDDEWKKKVMAALGIDAKANNQPSQEPKGKAKAKESSMAPAVPLPNHVEGEKEAPSVSFVPPEPVEADSDPLDEADDVAPLPVPPTPSGLSFMTDPPLASATDVRAGAGQKNAAAPLPRFSVQEPLTSPYEVTPKNDKKDKREKKGRSRHSSRSRSGSSHKNDKKKDKKRRERSRDKKDRRDKKKKNKADKEDEVDSDLAMSMEFQLSRIQQQSALEEAEEARQRAKEKKKEKERRKHSRSRSREAKKKKKEKEKEREKKKKDKKERMDQSPAPDADSAAIPPPRPHCSPRSPVSETDRRRANIQRALDDLAQEQERARRRTPESYTSRYRRPASSFSPSYRSYSNPERAGASSARPSTRWRDYVGDPNPRSTSKYASYSPRFTSPPPPTAGSYSSRYRPRSAPSRHDDDDDLDSMPHKNYFSSDAPSSSSRPNPYRPSATQSSATRPPAERPSMRRRRPARPQDDTLVSTPPRESADRDGDDYDDEPEHNDSAPAYSSYASRRGGRPPPPPSPSVPRANQVESMVPKRDAVVHAVESARLAQDFANGLRNVVDALKAYETVSA